MFDDHARHSTQANISQKESPDSLGDMTDPKSAVSGGTPLSLANEHDQLIITAIYGGRHYRRQLMDMGLRPGLQIKVIRAGGKGPMLVSVGETRLAIGRGMVEKILAIPVTKAAHTSSARSS